jgi:hypothetical protein
MEIRDDSKGTFDEAIGLSILLIERYCDVCSKKIK